MIVRDLRHARRWLRLMVPGALALAVLTVAPAAAQPSTSEPPAGLAQGKLDLNAASLEQLLALPVPADVARAIHELRTYVGYFDDVYDLRDVPGVTSAMLIDLRPLVATLPPPPPDAAVARMAASYRQVRNYLGQEGSSEGLVDEYLDLLQDPANVNELDLFDLMSFQNVSPVDATAIIKARERMGGIQSGRQLRRSDGLRYFAYRNLRDFVVYDDAELGDQEQVRADYQLRYYDTPIYGGNDDIVDDSDDGISIVRFRNVQTYNPAMSHKLRVDLPGAWQAGVRTYRGLGEMTWDETAKAFVEVKNQQLGPFRLKRAVAGSFRVAFGSGLIMDNTDFVHFRKTGYGWNKRPLGIRGDLSRTREYRLTGGAVEGTVGQTHLTLFAASDWRDAILNDDGTINRYVLMRPRFDEESLDFINNVRNDSTNLSRNAFRENLVGANVKQMLAPGTYLGATVVHSDFNRAFNADPGTLIDGGVNSQYWEARDSEIAAGYTSVFLDPAGDSVTEYKWRRMYGLEGQAVLGNASLQAEYSWLQDPRESFLSGDHHDAFIANAFAQWDNLHVLAIYRDYDVGYDNPFSRAFSNDSRYEQTILDSPYRLKNDWYSLLSSENPQPKGERGLFLDLRYRISRKLIINGLQFDQWTRKSDGADQWRWTAKLEYQPKFNVRFRLRQRVSARTEQNDLDVRTYRSWESRLQAIFLLSNFNRLQIMYSGGNVNFPARQRLSYPADPSSNGSGVGIEASPSSALEVKYEHNVNPWLRLTAAAMVYDGFLWNFEGNEFVLLDANGWRQWFKAESRISDRMLVQLKVTRDHNRTIDNVDVRRFGEEYDDPSWAGRVPKDDLFVRLQVDYSF
jgi:DNA uptake protein ComE-like DNA-binding protein